MAAGGRRRRGGAGGGGHEGPDERWLLTYADMITLLMALFIVMFAISSVNTSKFEALQKSLKEAFSGNVLPGGQSVLQTGGSDKGHQTPKVQPPVPAIQPLIQKEFDKEQKKRSGSSEGTEDEQFRKVKRDLDEYAEQNGLKNKLETEITRRGLVIRLLTDGVLFDSGQAKIKPRALPVLEKIAGLLQVDREHPINVEGHTDNVPIQSSQYPTNWELSTARAASVVRLLIADNAPAERLGAVGYAQLHPIASNSSAAGRSRNRRVEIVLLRVNNNASP
jgi:chemotaxis protein MotB